MNFETLQKGIYSLVMSVSVTLGSTLLPPSPSSPSQNALQDPGVIESFNVPAENSLDNYNIEIPTAIASSEETTPSPLPEVKVLGTEHKILASEIVEEATKAAIVTVELPAKPQKKLVKADEKAKIEPKAESPKKEESEVAKETPSSVPVIQKLAANAEKLFEMANQHRKELGLAPFEKEEKICKIAETRAPQVHDEVFVEGPLHKGFKALNLPYWATENIAAYSTIEQNFKFWITDAIHKKAVEGPSKYSCIACSGTSCSQIFTSFIPK